MKHLSRFSGAAGSAVCAFLLFALVFALFAPSVRYGLVDLDDYGYISQNRIVLQGFSLDNARRAFSSGNTAATMYMPLLWVSYMADVSLFGASGENVAPFHAVNVFLHASSAVLLFLLLRRLRARPLWAFLLALLWAVHPLRVESVAWITERKDVLSAFFGLAATLVWISSTAPGRRLLSRAFRLAVATLLYAAGLLVKPSLVPLPLAWLALDVWPLRRLPFSPLSPGFLRAAVRVVAEQIPAALCAAAAAWLAVAQHHAVSGALAVSWRLRLAAVAPNFLFYVRKTLLPLGLSPLVPEQWRFSPLHVLLALFVCAAFASAVWRFRRVLPSLLPGAVWTLVFFLPASGLQPLPMNTVADRFFYLPAIGLSIAFAALPAALPAKPRRILAFALAAALLPLSAATARLLPTWRDSEALYARVLSLYPSHVYASPAAATALIGKSGDFAKADELVAPLLPRYPGAAHIHLVHAHCLAHLQSPEEALRYLSSCDPPQSVHDKAARNLAMAELELALDRPRDAIAHATEAMSTLPADSTIRSVISCLLLAAALSDGDSALALRYARQTPFYATLPAVRLEHAMPFAIVQWIEGNRKDALDWFSRILEAYPDRIDLWNNVVWGLSTAAWSPAPPSQVVQWAEHMRSLAPSPDIPGLLDTLAAAYANAGDFGTAADLERRALANLPPNAPGTAEIRNRAALFEKGIPYREDGFERLFVTMFGPVAQSL